MIKWGDRSKDPKSVYASPLKPEVCSILSLDIYFLLFPLKAVDGKIFNGDGQTARYSSSLQRF